MVMTDVQGLQRAAVVAGSVVLLSDLESDELLVAVVRRASEEDLTVVPVSADVQFASEWDLLLPRDLLGYTAMAQVWNFGTVLPEQIADVAAVLRDDERRALDALAKAARTGEVPVGLPIGPATLDDADPRLLHQDAEAEAVRRFWAPALTLAGAETLGQLVHHRREELGVAVDELESVTTAGGWLSDLEDDRLELRSALPSSALAAVMRRLRIGASRRLGRIMLWTIEGQAPSFARKGQHGQEGDLPAAEEYIAAILRELEGD